MSKNENTTEYKSLYDYILNDKSYYNLFEFIRRTNNFMNEVWLENSTSETHDGSVMNASSKFLLLQSYDSIVIDYIKSSYTHSYLDPDNIMIDHRCSKWSIAPFHDMGLGDEVYNNKAIEFSPNCYSTDYSAELFTASLDYDVLSEKEIVEVLNRISNLPLREGYVLKLHSGLLHMDYTCTLDKFLRGYL